MADELISIGTIIVAFATIGTLIISWHHYTIQNTIAKKNINYNAMLQIMKIFNDSQTARNRDVIYRAYREHKLYAEDASIQTYFVGKDSSGVDRQLTEVVASVRGSFDQMGKLVEEGYVTKNEFLDMYVDPVIRMWKVLRCHILHERTVRGHDHFMVYFEHLYNDAKIFWNMRFTDIPEPVPF